MLSVLGADTTGSRYLEPDGMFPNHVPNPEAKEAMDSICEAVRESGADLGVIFDTDVDRGGAVDSKGNEINRNRLVAVAAAIALEGNDGGMIVTDSITSSGLKQFIEMTSAESITAIAEAIRMLSTRLLNSTLRASTVLLQSKHRDMPQCVKTTFLMTVHISAQKLLSRLLR